MFDEWIANIIGVCQRAIHPVHTMSDGDSIFVLSSGEVEVMADAVGMLATEMMAKAIKRAVLHAESAYGYRP